jgi:osmoprotectant transport system permease protein
MEAGRGMGLRERQILTGLELPLAAPIIVGGFRTATLQVIATATIGAIVSGGGLGRFIVDGIHNQDYTTVVGGVILVSGLAIGADFVLAESSAGSRRAASSWPPRAATSQPTWPRRSLALAT